MPEPPTPPAPPTPPSFEELCNRVPELVELEARTRAVRDDGSASFFCANNTWFAIRRRLDELVGVWRLPGGPADDVLGGSAAHEVALAHLYPLLPPCRACGCECFEPLREEQLRARGRRALEPGRGPA